MRLNLHRLLGTHKDALSVKVRVKGNALLGDLTKLGKREHLESARIGKNGSIPVEELMKSAHLIDEIVAGSDVKMIGIRELDLTADLF